MPDTKLGEIKLRGFARLTLEDIRHLNSAIKAIQTFRKDQGFGENERYARLQHKLETILREERGR